MAIITTVHILNIGQWEMKKISEAINLIETELDIYVNNHGMVPYKNMYVSMGNPR